MEHENKIKQPLIIVSLTLAALITLSLIKFEYFNEDLNFTIRNVDLLSDIKEEPIDEQNMNHRIDEPIMNKASFGFILGLDFFTSKKDNTADAMFFQGRKSPITGNTKQLSYFFDALKSAKSKNVRIAHFGDSVIEGDLVTADVREALQNKFGGNGVGWLGIVSQDINFRLTTKHSFSNGNWEQASVYTSNRNKLPYGISCEANIPKGNAWVQYETTTSKRYLRDFNTVKLYYTNAKNSTINYSFDGGTKQSAQLKTGSNVQELVLTVSGKARSVKIEFPVSDQANVFGVSLENGPGVYMDNFPLRGNSGVDLQQMDPNLLKDFASLLDYKLIVLEFGLNIVNVRADYSWYEREMMKVINQLKAVFPRTSLLLVSVHDKAMKKGSSFVTDPSILKLHAAQKEIADQTGIAFWSLFDAMGGENSMQHWVNANPPMAFKDYIHFNDQGARKVAQLFSDALLELYR